MLSSTSSRRLGAAALAAALAASGLLAGAAPAQAATLGTTFSGASVTFDQQHPSSVVCTQTGADVDSAPPGTFAANGVPVTSTASSSAVITDAGNASDQTTMSGSITTTVTASGAGGQLTGLHLAATASASLATAVADTKCGASVAANGGATFQFDLAVPTLVTITSETRGLTGIAQVASTNPAPSSGSSAVDGVISYNAGNHATNTSSAVLPAGTGLVSVSQAQTGLFAPITARTLSTSGSLTLDVTFQPAGAASTAASGSARKYVSLGAARDCAGGTLPLTWTKRAGKGKDRAVNKATVKVNGVKVATIKKPKRNQVTPVKGLSADQAADVEVSFHLRGKGKFTVERSYLRCA